MLEEFYNNLYVETLEALANRGFEVEVNDGVICALTAPEV